MNTSPALVPAFDFDTYLVVDEIGHSRVYRETEEIDADRAALMIDVAAGQYSRPLRVVAFNAGEGWARDVSEDIAREMLDAAVRSGQPLTRFGAELHRTRDRRRHSAIRSGRLIGLLTPR